MATFEIIMPKLGESIIEATISKWLKKEGDSVAEDESILEIATDKVDSEIPSPVKGILIKQFFHEGDVVEIGKVIAVIDMGGEPAEKKKATSKEAPPAPAVASAKHELQVVSEVSASSRFYSPLIKNIAKQENLTMKDLDQIREPARMNG